MVQHNSHTKKQGIWGLFSSFFDKKPVEDRLINRPPRVSLNRLHAVSFDMTTPLKQPGLGVANISRTGIGFLAGHTQWPQTGETVQGTLNIMEYKLPATLRVVHVTSVIAGCHFSLIGQEYSEILTEYFDAELDAIQLVEVNPMYLKKLEEGTPVWFKGLDNSELFIVHEDMHINSFIITFLGTTVSWMESGNAPQYGILYPSAEGDLQFQRQTEALFDPLEINTTALKFIYNIKGLNRDFIKQIETILTNGN